MAWPVRVMIPIILMIRALLATVSRRLVARGALVVRIVVLEGVRRMRLVVVVRMLRVMVVVRVLRVITEYRPVEKRVVNQRGMRKVSAAVRDVGDLVVGWAVESLVEDDFLVEDDLVVVEGGAAAIIALARRVSRFGGVRKDVMASHSMYAWVMEAVVERRGVMRRAMRRGGEMVRV